MGAPSSGMKAADEPAAETLLTAFKTLSAAERRRHASVLNYWLSVRGDKEFPPLHDLDPLELSDAGPNSVLLELISGGHDAEVRHLGEALRDEAWPERIIDAPNPSVLACIAKKLPIVAISRDFLAYEDEYEGPSGKVRCSVTLLPLSAGGAWVDYVYALVTAESAPAKGAKGAEAPKKTKVPEPKTEPEEAEETIEVGDEQQSAVGTVEEPVDDIAEEPTSTDHAAITAEASSEEVEGESESGPVVAAVARAAPGFSKLLDSIAGLTGFYGSQPVKVEPVIDEEPAEEVVDELPVEETAAKAPIGEASAAEEPAADVSAAKEPAAKEPAAKEPAAEEPTAEEHAAEEPTAEVHADEEPAAEEPLVEETAADEHFIEQPVAETAEPKAEEAVVRPAGKTTKPSAPVASEGSLQNKLTEVRAKADEARMARLRATATLYEGLSAAYDFALDAEETPEDYLRLVEAQGLKIQLRSPMKPVVKLAFAGMCDDATIRQLEAVLAWAFDEELPRGTLAERIESAGGIGAILGVQAKAA